MTWSYLMPNSDNSTDQPIILPASSYFCNTLLMGQSIVRQFHDFENLVEASWTRERGSKLSYQSSGIWSRCIPWTIATLTTSGNATRYTNKKGPMIGLLSMRGWGNVCLTALNASSHVSFHENLLAFFISLRIGFILSVSLGINLDNDVNLLTNR